MWHIGVKRDDCHQFGGSLEHASKAKSVESVVNTCFTGTWELAQTVKLVPFFCERKIYSVFDCMC